MSSLVVDSGASSHLTRFKGKALCLCVFGGGVGEVGAGLREGEEGVFGVVLFHSTRFKAKALCRCVFSGGVGEVGARRGDVVGKSWGVGITPSGIVPARVKNAYQVERTPKPLGLLRE